ncbi:MAG: pantetheine-phosphate adenylyltransferase [Muribaculaceae bacterium]|nr:pantetheine-phosphate adenylyltransferase [Muribaculaceae bacterium]
MTAKSPDQKQVIGLFAGSFDPFTIGHLSIVTRALPLFDKLVIAVGVNESKTGATTPSDRMEAIRRATAALGPKIEVTSWSGLTADLARRLGATYLLRGARTAADFDYETTLATINRDIAGLETIIIPTLPEHAAISSSVVRELAHFGYDPSKYLP